MDQINEQLLKAIEMMIDQKLSELHYDKTLDGKIVSKTDKGYLVGVGGREIVAKCSRSYSNGDVVRVHVPQNNWNKAYID